MKEDTKTMLQRAYIEQRRIKYEKERRWNGWCTAIVIGILILTIIELCIITR